MADTGRKNFCKMKFSGISFGGVVLAALVIAVFKSIRSGQNVRIDQLLAYQLGYVDFQNYNRFLNSMLPFLFPQLVLLLMWGNYFEKNIRRNSAIIYTRTSNVKSVVNKYLREVCVSVNLLSFFMRTMYSLLLVLGAQLFCLQMVYLCEQEQLPAEIASGLPVSAVLFCRNQEKGGFMVGRWSVYLGIFTLILYGVVCVLLRRVEHAD